MYWTFRQNNSGGDWMVDEDVSHFVIVEANSMEQANNLAQSHGIYFHGFGDCQCCGNRWSRQWDEDDGTEEPMIYGHPASAFLPAYWDEEVTIYHLDGRKERFEIKAKK